MTCLHVYSDMSDRELDEIIDIAIIPSLQPSRDRREELRLPDPRGAARGLVRAVGDDVNVDATATFYGASRIALGSHIRIDAGVVLSAGDGGIHVGDHVHIAVRVFMTGAAKIELRNFAGVSAGTAIFSSNDDCSGAWLTGPGHPGRPAQRHQRPRAARGSRDRRRGQRHPPRRHDRTGSEIRQRTGRKMTGAVRSSGIRCLLCAYKTSSWSILPRR